MADRTKAVLFSVLISGYMSLAGCGYYQQSRFQMAFLPSAASPATAVPDVAEPPAVEPGYYPHTAPAILAPKAPGSLISQRAQSLMDNAEQRFQRGRRLYQANNIERARKEFDAAIDLMMEASGQPIMDQQAFDRRLDRMVDAIHRYDLAGLGSAVNEEQAQFEKAPLEDILEMTFPVDPKLKTRVREQIKATASQLPLSINDAVLGYIHYFMGRGHKTLVYGLERSGRYKPMIQRILDEEGVPQELIHLAQAESGFQPRAISRKAATGMWQFMAFRGQQYGLMRTPSSDDRLDPEKATRAAARHLHDLYTEFGDWYLAIAAYNCGPGVVEKAVERTGFADFWELRNRRVLPAETTNYVPIILAMTIMAKNAPEYGIADISPDTPMEYDTVELSAPTHLALVADLTDAPVSELMALNPSLLRTTAPEKFALHVPKGTANSVLASLEMIPLERRAAWRIHRVESGETLAEIGKRYGASPANIVAVNRLPEAGPAAGDRLVIPAAPPVERTVKAATRRTSARTAKTRGSHRHTTTVARSGKTAAKPVTAKASSRRATAKKGTTAASVRRGPVTASSRTRPHATAN